VVQVGSASIAQATVDHWASAIRRGNGVGASLGRSGGTPRERALDFLIASHWLIGQALRDGLLVSGEAVQRGLRERVEAVPDGESEFRRELASTGQTVADVELEIKAKLATEAISESLSKRIPPVTRVEVARYYEHNRSRFRVPDQREVDLIEGIESPRAAAALGRRLGTGARFTRKAIREIVARQTRSEAAHRGNHQLVHAIFATPLGKLGGPVIFNNLWVLLVVRKLIPSTIKPLASVSEKIEQQLLGERHRSFMTRYLAGYRRTWTEQTTCRAGYVVQRCREYRGPTVPEGNPFGG
jgi:hypothetical protein